MSAMRNSRRHGKCRHRAKLLSRSEACALGHSAADRGGLRRGLGEPICGEQGAAGHHGSTAPFAWRHSLCADFAALEVALACPHPDAAGRSAGDSEDRGENICLYLLLLPQPICGIVHTNAQGRRVDFYFLGELPTLVGRDKVLAGEAMAAHEFAAYPLSALIGLHAAAALFHHYIRRDSVLKGMPPVRRREPRSK